MSVDNETDEERTAREAAESAAANEKKFTQADLDRVVQERLARDRKERPSDEEIAELRAAKTKLDELEASNQSELEKANARAEKAEQEREAALTEAKETRFRTAILTEASKADRKVVDPQAVLALIDKSSLTLSDDGTPTNIAEAMDALLADKTYLVGNGGTATRQDGADQGARGGGGTGVEQLTSTDGMSQDEIATAVSEGRLDTYMSTAK